MKGVALSVESMGIIIAVMQERVKRVCLTEPIIEGFIKDKESEINKQSQK